MSFRLSQQTERLVEQRLASGDYESADEIIQVALGALEEREDYNLDEATLAAIDSAEDQAERGEVHDWADVRDSVRAKFLGK